MWVYFIDRYVYMWQLEAFILRYTSYVTSTFLSPRIILIVQVANILYTCASNTQEKQIFNIRIFERNSKNERVYLQLFVSFKIGAMTHLLNQDNILLSNKRKYEQNNSNAYLTTNVYNNQILFFSSYHWKRVQVHI